MTLVSVVVPVYNASKYLNSLFNTLLNQTFTDIEIICVDDGSKDDSAEIIKKFACKDIRIKLIEQPNQGGGAARNTGIEHAGGKYVICLDSDDDYEKDLIENLYNQAQKTNADITFCKYKKHNIKTGRIAGNKGVTYKLLPDKEVFSKKDVPDIFALADPVPYNKLYKTEFIKSRNLKYSLTKSTNDLAFTMLAFAFAKRISFVDKELATYRFLTPGSGSTSREKYSYQCVIAFKEIYNILKENSMEQTLKDSYIQRVLNSIYYELNFPVGEKFFSSIKEFLQQEPFNTIDKSIIKERFDTKPLYKNYIEYLLLNIITFGLIPNLREKVKLKSLIIKNTKKLLNIL